MTPSTAPSSPSGPRSPAWTRVWQSLGAKFFLLIFLGFVFTAAVAFLSFQWVYGNIVEQIGMLFAEKQVLYDRERSLAPIRREVTLASMLANSPTIHAWLANESDPARKARGLRELETFRQAFADKSYFFAVARSGHYYFNDAAGQYTGREMRYTMDRKNAKDAWFYATLEQPEPCLLNPDFAVDIQVTKLWINCIVRKGNEPMAVIGTGIDLSSFIRDVIATPNPRLLTLFMDRSGAIQAHRNPKLINYSSLTKSVNERKTIFDQIPDAKQRETLRRLMDALAMGQRPVATAFITIDGVRYLAGLTYIKEFGWFNLTLMGIDLVAQEYYAPILLILLATLLTFLVVSAVLVKLVVLDRISQLDDSVRSITRGMYDIQVSAGSRDEIGRLSTGFEVMAQAIRDQTQNLEAKVERRTAELQAANDAKDKLFSVIAHDLRGPVGIVRGITHEMRPGATLDPEILASARGSAEYAYDLLEDLLLWASSQSGRMKSAPVRFSLPFELAILLSGVRNTAKDKGIEIATAIPEDLEVRADVDMVKIILRNLVANAIKFSNTGTQIRVTAQVDGATVRIAVQDQGVGLAPEALLRLFQVGQANPSTLGTRKERGTGLGLILCKELATRNGGDILVESVPGQGSTFTLVLPYP